MSPVKAKWNPLIGLLQQREEVLKFHLKRSQDRMKQVSVRLGKYDKLSHKYYGPFKVQAKVGKVAYKLELPAQSQIHDVFHIYQLKKCSGKVLQGGELPHCDGQSLIQAEPMAILDRKLKKVGNAAVVFVLVHWPYSSKEDATWESIKYIQARFPHFNVLASSWDKIILSGWIDMG
ncbi:retrotransposable element Tf2 [Tanacetum coccineum]